MLDSIDSPDVARAATSPRLPVHLVLALPGLLAPDVRVGARLCAPHIARLIATAGAPSREPDGLDAALASRYGITRETDWPLAPIRLAALGVDPGHAYWLAADPVTLVAGRDDVRLHGPVTDLTRDESTDLIDALNAHFIDDGLAFVAPRPDAWFVRAADAPKLSTRPLPVAVGRTLRALLPSGADAGTWRRWQNEIQMLFHEHPVNLERERTGRAPANSVWFSCGGTLQARTASPTAIRTWANGGVVAALAAHAGAPALPPPDNLDRALAGINLGPTPSRLGIHRDRTDRFVAADTIVVAIDPPLGIAAVERDWCQPACNALARGTLHTVTVITDGAGDAVAWTAGRFGWWRRIADGFTTHDLAPLFAAARTDD